jgi:AmmeMemoRadiSam system protein B
MLPVREPVVAGYFYAGRREALLTDLRGCFLHELGPGRVPQVRAEGPGLVQALVSPHAGYMFSGPAAAHGFVALAEDGVPETAVILGPSHSAAARTAAISLASGWRTPLGEVAVDVELGNALIQATSLLVADEYAHMEEHSLEVQVPFLQFVYGDRTPKICPICIRSHPSDPLDRLIPDVEELGSVLAKTLGGRRAVLIASSDFSHRIPHAHAQRQDKLALDQILALDPAGLLRAVAKHHISTCGPIPVAIALACCRAAGPHTAELLKYYTSGDITGDRAEVVGYASVCVRRTDGPPQRPAEEVT